MNYEQKYLKYKTKYLNLKNLSGGLSFPGMSKECIKVDGWWSLGKKK